MVAFIDQHRDEAGVEPLCRQLQIAPSTYYAHKAQQVDPAKLSKRSRRDLEVGPEIERRRTSGSTAPARCGDSFSAKGSRSRAAPLSD